jgi:uncharacterized membrane protein
MTWYTFFKSLHVVTAAIWFGGALMIQAFAFRIIRTNDARRMADFAKDSEVVGMRVFIPATWVLLLAAVGLMLNADLSWGQNWIVLGLIAWAVSFAVGAGFLGPEGGRIAKIIERDGPESPAAQARRECRLVLGLDRRDGRRRRRRDPGLLLELDEERTPGDAVALRNVNRTHRRRIR